MASPMSNWTLPPLHLRSTWRFWVSVAILTGVGANLVVRALLDWHLDDMAVYRAAAERIIEGEPLYGGDATALTAYRYSPWFAFAWVPLAGLPDPVVNVGWSVALVAASAVSLIPVTGRHPIRVLLVLMFGPVLFAISASGNVQPLLVGALSLGLYGRWAWLAIAFAASLKVVPIAFVIVLVGQRRWFQALAATTVSALLWAPVLMYDVAPFTVDPGPARMLPVPAWLLVAGTSAAVALWLAYRRSELTTLSASVAAVLALPRLFLYEVTLLVPAIPRVGSDPKGRDTESAS